MTERIKKLKDELLRCRDEYSLERAEIVTEVYAASENESPMMQRAKTFAAVMERSSLYVNEQDLLVGNLSPVRGERPLFPEFHIGVAEHGKTGSVGEKINVADYPDLKPILESWEGCDLFSEVNRRRPDGVRWMQEELIINSAAEVNGHGHLVVDNRRILANGYNGLIRDILNRREQSSDPAVQELCDASVIALKGAIACGQRYAALLEELAVSAESGRAAELRRMAEVMQRVPGEAPQSFYEALQVITFVYVTLHHEHNGYSISLGRLDKDLYPFYKADVDKGVLTREEAFELIECFCLKVMELPIGGVLDNKTAVVTIGGLNVDGTYECNEVSYLFLETIKTLRLNSPAVIIRWHETAPLPFKEAAVDMLKYGTGYPGIFGDEAVIRGMMQEHGATAEEAHEWTEVGCAEVYMTGKSRPVDAGLVNLPVTLVLALNNGESLLSGRAIGIETASPQSVGSIDEVISLYERTFFYLLDREVELDRIIKGVHRDLRPVPYTNALMTECIERGSDLLDLGAKFDLTCVGLFSYANLIDSLVAIEELVFNRNELTLPEFVVALKRNFEGDGELLEKIGQLPKFGNDNPRADRFIPVVNDIHYRGRKMIMEKYGVDVSYEAIPREVHIDLGLISPATFDGRRKGEPFADGASPSQGKDRSGLTGLLNSVMKLDAAKHITNGYVLNLKVLPRLIDSPEFLERLITALDVYFKSGGEQIQVSCTRPEDLREAQRNPDNHRNLIVRVAGFSAYFVTLRPELQEEVVSRTLYQN